MVFTKTELDVVYQIGMGNTTVMDIALILKKSKSQVYRAMHQLDQKGIVNFKRNSFELMPNIHTNLLVNNLVVHPNLTDLLSGYSILILQECLELKAISDVESNTYLNKSTIYNWIKKFQKVSIVKKVNAKYVFNDKLWSDLRSFLVEFKKFNDSIDTRVSSSSKIYYKDEDLIVFSSKNLEEASFTAFSAYKDFGVKILTTKNYYVLPVRVNSVMDVFLHSLYVTEKETDFRNLMFVALFYLKHKNKLNKVKHFILDNIRRVLKGESIEGYPTLLDIENRVADYD